MCRSILCSFFSLATLIIAAVYADESPLRVIKDAEGRPIAIEAIGWTKDEVASLARLDAYSLRYLSERLGIQVLDDKGEALYPALSGSYEVVSGAIRFRPQFPLRPGMAYQAFFGPIARIIPQAGDLPIDFPRRSLKIKVPATPPAPPARVTAIYPSARTLPENQLRFYIHFSAPMAAGDAYSHVKLLKADGDEVKRAFLEIGEELWDGSGQRLTLLFDPGRVKQGLTPREEFGPVLEAGNSYRLVIDKAWRDANGQPLVAEFEKKFVAGPAVEAAVDFKAWKITPPLAGAREPLIIRFPRSLDRALLLRMLTVAETSGMQIPGEITLGDEERGWEFRPAQPWTAGSFAIVADTALEDSAGNNLARPFEVDVFDRVDEKPGPEFVRIPFNIEKK